ALDVPPISLHDALPIYSFVDPKVQQLVDPDARPVEVANPISSDMAVMRTSLWAGLIPVLARNLNRQQSRIYLFETGLRFVEDARSEEHTFELQSRENLV